ncbi:condensation domain-containing protein, partial [Streptomyces sp. DH12]|uniref:condensation domain-containing protein n=1 Tax=Streptomyces sp. DH12 TaxID=2857010 RepID=UPI001E373FEC
ARDRLDPFTGRTGQAVWLDAGDGRPGTLLLTLHHLVVDGVSWRILLPDLKAAWEDPHTPLPPVGTPFRAWALHLAEQARTERRGGELGRDDVVFGATVSHRPPEIPGIESTIGMFVNTLPVRVRVRPW